ncbi:bifunctional adenosylcobinamide kinase/adenosylcobinamide-phosphate guanylyltransferase [Halalkalibacterium ligniniphilum]|uniref:bifunctional adenosylcobinamide kinase/adenosylcobinamide-phosphate guanylyltransferase n=1 Tax=Halalkalibacterium ligniniphilum TaxID=1134413 RepID=UPI00034ABC4C|nr:bifunctional adenosylcobinamide kinase/adenosylcobinamide-phosphate guanylyltransferase [Halalkalibacterium ligniniphilum]
MLLFVTGAVRSGKSSYAEKRAIDYVKAVGGSLHYIATSQVEDEEMKKRIDLHQQTRKKSNVSWMVYEQPYDLQNLLPRFQQKDVVLIDCLTTLLNNEMFREWQKGEDYILNKCYLNTIYEKLAEMLSSYAHGPWTTIVVSNEIGEGLPHTEKGTMAYLALLGKLHQWAVQLADEAILVEYGIPILKKGVSQE